MEINTKKDGYYIIKDGNITYGEIKKHNDVNLAIEILNNFRIVMQNEKEKDDVRYRNTYCKDIIFTWKSF